MLEVTFFAKDTLFSSYTHELSRLLNPGTNALNFETLVQRASSDRIFQVAGKLAPEAVLRFLRSVTCGVVRRTVLEDIHYELLMDIFQKQFKTHTASVGGSFFGKNPLAFLRTLKEYLPGFHPLRVRKTKHGYFIVSYTFC